MSFNFKVDSSEVLRYMGYRNQEIDSDLRKRIDKCRELILKEAEPRYISEYHEIEEVEDYIRIKDSHLILKGADIKTHLSNCKRVVLIAATLGNNIDKLIKLKGRTTLEEAIILDAAATTLIEEFCDFIEEKISMEVSGEGKSITFRYSPGYGDLPIETQKSFVSTVSAYSKIGLSVSENSILIPRKSVTAIIGISDENRIAEKRSCLNCENYEKCLYRKEGSSCGR